MRSPAIVVFSLFLLVMRGFASCHCNNETHSTNSSGTELQACDCNDSIPIDDALHLAGILDQESWSWFPDVFAIAVDMVNNKTDGWYDEIKINVSYALGDSSCDASQALREYWRLRPVHGLVAARCSGASMAIARLATLEGIPQISPLSTASRLSDNDEFPFFSRLVAPDDARGEVGAITALLDSLGWKRVSILATDTDFAKDLSKEFQKLWTAQKDHKIAYPATISFDRNTDQIDLASVEQVLAGVPTDDPTVNSRVIILAAHEKDAYDILKHAQTVRFQEDTIWIAFGWAGILPSANFTTWISRTPGYLGVAPYQQVSPAFLRHIQSVQAAKGLGIWNDLPHYVVSYIVDAVVAIAKAFDKTDRSQWNDGMVVTEALRGLDFQGVSGRVEFTEEGDRKKPQYSIMNLQSRGSMVEWKQVGTTSITKGSTSIPRMSSICFGSRCSLSSPPSELYPVPKDRIDTWIMIVLIILGLLALFFFAKYSRKKKQNRNLKQTVSLYQQRIDRMKEIDNDLADADKQVELAKAKQQALILQRAALQDKPATWTPSNEILVNVAPTEDEYWTVLQRLQEDMPDAHISKLWRVQNESLWTYYSFHKDRLGMNNIFHNEMKVWHGTSSLDPSVIYEDRQDGFMMQFSKEGLWGRGIYFAKRSFYSHSYAYRPLWTQNSRPCSDGKDDEREMFLAKLLVGDQVKLSCNRNLTVPPVNPSTKMKYNSVTGDTGGSQVWIVYENGRAYPDYLVRYYRGSRNKSKTPFGSKREAMEDRSRKAIPGAKVGDIELGLDESSPASTTCESDSIAEESQEAIVWEFEDNGNTWRPYGEVHQKLLEATFQETKRDLSSSGLTRITTSEWTYEVNVRNFTQRNVQHSSNRVRSIRRRENVRGRNRVDQSIRS